VAVDFGGRPCRACASVSMLSPDRSVAAGSDERSLRSYKPRQQFGYSRPARSSLSRQLNAIPDPREEVTDLNRMGAGCIRFDLPVGGHRWLGKNRRRALFRELARRKARSHHSRCQLRLQRQFAAPANGRSPIKLHASVQGQFLPGRKYDAFPPMRATPHLHQHPNRPRRQSNRLGQSRLLVEFAFTLSNIGVQPFTPRVSKRRLKPDSNYPPARQQLAT
jgi:hypothetical protein